MKKFLISCIAFLFIFTYGCALQSKGVTDNKTTSACVGDILRTEHDDVGQKLIWLDKNCDGTCDVGMVLMPNGRPALMPFGPNKSMVTEFSCEDADALWNMYRILKGY